MCLSPLDQFRIFPILSFNWGNFDFSFTNSAFILILVVGSFFYIVYLYICPNVYLPNVLGNFLVPNNRWFLIIEDLYLTISSLIYDNVGVKGQSYFPFFFVVFIFILQLNLIGLVPYSFTVTSHIILTFSLAITVFVGVVIIGMYTHKKYFLNLFLPSGTGLSLALLLVPLEIISFLSKPISLSVRLFANMMAGHTLLKVIAGFAWTMMTAGNFLFFAHLLPLILLFLLVGLEFGVALIQAYVFTVLSCIYLNDSINLH